MGGGARDAALEAVVRCRRDRAWSGAAIDAAIKKYALQGPDAALASRLFLGTLQNVQLCDYYVNLYHSRGGLEPVVRDILRLGVYQLLFMDRVPARAAVNETVALCRRAGFGRAAGLVNAVLRRISEAGKDSLPEVPGTGTAEYLSIKYSHPLWLAERLIAEKGYAFTERFFEADNRAFGLTLQVNTLKVGADDYALALKRRGIECRSFEWLPGCLELDGGKAADLYGYGEGLFYVQDRAARSAVAAAGPRPGMTVLDACAAPGGKSFAAAIAMGNRGEIRAGDISEKKLRLITEGAKRLGIDIISATVRDAREPDDALRGRFDLVLADLPCSGLGLMGKRPETRMKTDEETASLPGLQSEILSRLAEYVKPGGALMYSTCTVLRRENEAVVEEFLSRDGRFAPEDFELGPVRSEDGMYTFWPHIDGTDGFFAAKLKKKR